MHAKSPKVIFAPASGDVLAMMSREPDFFAKLTHRQREVLTLLAQRLSDSKIARLFQIAEATVKMDMAAF